MLEKATNSLKLALQALACSTVPIETASQEPTVEIQGLVTQDHWGHHRISKEITIYNNRKTEKKTQIVFKQLRSSRRLVLATCLRSRFFANVILASARLLLRGPACFIAYDLDPGSSDL